MHRRVVELLACPTCRVAVVLQDGDAGWGDRVETGRLVCMQCDRTYPVARGIPRFVSESEIRGADDETRQTVAHFVTEFTAYADGDADIGDLDDVAHHFFERTGISAHVPDSGAGEHRGGVRHADAPYLHEKCILDAGCGPGRFTEVAARSAAHVVGLDIGDHVERAAARCRDLDKVDFVQGSVLAPPFRAGTFDYVFSLGVLHHTPDPKLGCLRLAELVKPTGAMSIWVYPPEYWGRPIQRTVGRCVNRVLRRLPPRAALSICERWLYPLGRLQMALSHRRWSRLLAAPVFLLGVPRHPEREVMIATIYDHFGPALITTHTYDEVEGWLREAGFTRLRQIAVPTACFAERAASQDEAAQPL